MVRESDNSYSKKSEVTLWVGIYTEYRLAHVLSRESSSFPGLDEGTWIQGKLVDGFSTELIMHQVRYIGSLVTY